MTQKKDISYATEAKRNFLSFCCCCSENLLSVSSAYQINRERERIDPIGLKLVSYGEALILGIFTQQLALNQTENNTPFIIQSKTVLQFRHIPPSSHQKPVHIFLNTAKVPNN